MALNEWPELPIMKTEVPGPLSRQIFAEESLLRSSGTSAGSQWSKLAIVDGKGCMVRDADGNIFLDACSGTVAMNIGHGNEQIARVVFEQTARLTHFYDFPSPVRLSFLKKLREVSPSSCESFLLLNSGAEAVDAALRIARSATRRDEFISFRNGYHGRTFGALSLTSGAGRKGMGPLIPGCHIIEAPMISGLASDEEIQDNLEAYKKVFISTINDVCTDIPAAVIIEPIQGAGGTHPMPKEFLEFLRSICDELGILLVFDEILTGAGRTGRMWAHQYSDVQPDLLIAGKGIAGGLPFGMVGGRSSVLNSGSMGLPTRNSSTFGGNPVVCAAGLECLEALTSGGLIENAKFVGEFLISDLRDRLSSMSCIKDIRGRGLMIGIEIRDPKSDDPISMELIRGFLIEMMKRGVAISSSSPVLRITPPLSLSMKQAEWLSKIIAETIEKVFMS